MSRELPKGPFILWLDYYSEGWSPKSFETERELHDALENGDSHGQPFVITKRLELAVKE